MGIFQTLLAALILSGALSIGLSTVPLTKNL